MEYAMLLYALFGWMFGKWIWGCLAVLLALIALLLLKAVVQRQLLTNIGVPVSVW